MTSLEAVKRQMTGSKVSKLSERWKTVGATVLSHLVQKHDQT